MKYSFSLACFVIFNIFCPILNAQDIANREKAYLERAEQLYAEAQYERAIKDGFLPLSQVYERAGAHQKYALIYTGVGNCYIYLTRYAEAYAEFKRANNRLIDFLAHEKEHARLDTAYRIVPIDSNLVADIYEGYGRYFSNFQAKYDSAMTWHRRALDLRTRLLGAEHPKTALSYYFVGMCYRGLASDSSKNSVQLELANLEKALAIQTQTLTKNHYQTANTYQALGNYYYEVTNEYQKGYEMHEQALNIRKSLFKTEHPYIALSYLDLAYYARVMGEYEKEIEYLNDALRIQQNILGYEHRDVGVNLLLLANRYRSTGDIEKALNYYERARKIFTKLLSENSNEVAQAYLGMAACYRDFENPGDELNALNKALAIRTQIFGGQHFRTAEIFSEIGSYFLHLERGDSSLSYYNRALGIYKRQLGENHYAVAQTYDRLAKAYALKSNTEQEFYYLNESLNKKKFAGNAPKSNKTAQLSGTAEVADEFGESQTRQNHVPSQLYESYLNLAKFYGRKKDYTLALNYCQSALASVCPSLKNSKDYYQNPSIEELSHDIAWLDAIYTKSDLVLKLYQNQSKASKDLDFAVKSFELSVALIDTLRFHFTSDGSKEQLAKRSLPVYEGAVAVLSEVYNTSKDAKILDRIFTMMERSKAFVLMQAIQNVQAKTAGGVPAELLVKEESLRRGMAYYSDYKNRKNEDRGFDKMYFQTKKSYDSLIQVIETQYPKYYKLKYELKPIVLQQVREKILHEDDAILEYFVGDAALYGFVITKTDVFFNKIVLDKTFESDIYALRSNLTNYAAIAKNAEQAHRDFTRHSAAVFSKYVQPFTKNLPENTQKLIVVTDGLLSYLPFDILLTESVGGQLIPYAELPYLFKKYQLNYTYSTGLLMENLAERRISNNQKCLAFAPTYSEQNGNTHDDLPWAQKELEDIQKTFVGQYVFGKPATKSAFMEAASEYGIIHLAMHGVVNWRNAQKSYLAFATVDTDSTGEASNLYNYDIQNLYLNADLVVLSACETGFGKVIRGEGVLSLSRGFMYAGVPSMVTTLWQVNDYASATLMMLFYSNLARGFSKPEALRLAKLEFVSKGDLISGHPAFWASFVTLGNPQALRYGWAWWQWGILAVVLVGAGLGLFIVGKRYIRFKHAEHEANKAPEKSVEELITENLRRKIKASQTKQKTGQP